MKRQRQIRLGILLAAALGVAAGSFAPVERAEAGDVKEFLKKLTGKKKKKAKPEQVLDVQADSAAEETGTLAVGMTLDEAVQEVRRKHPKAEVIGAHSRDDEGGRTVHEVKVLRQSGQVKTYRFDAASGDIID